MYAKACTNMNNLKFSPGWLHAFLKRHRLSYRKRSTKIIVDQNVVNLGVEKFFNSIITKLSVSDELIFMANMDETRIEKDMNSDYTMSEKGIKNVPIRTTNSDRIGNSSF